MLGKKTSHRDTEDTEEENAEPFRGVARGVPFAFLRNKEARGLRKKAPSEPSSVFESTERLTIRHGMLGWGWAGG
jgi:hypothetical protein